MPTFTTAQLAQQLGAELVGDGSIEINSFAPAETAQAGCLTFAENEKFMAQAEAGGASAVLAGAAVTSTKKTLLRVKNPRLAFAKVLPLFFPEPVPTPGIHATAVVASSAQIDPTAHVGPHCVVGERVKIGARTALLGGNHVGDDAQLGDDVRLFPNAVLYPRTQVGQRVRIHAGAVIGSDGFGYVMDAGQHRKVLQIGRVILRDDVEIGANTCIDRAALGATVIGRGTKIDNLVQIAHNVVTGDGCLIVSQVGIAGSTTLGNYVVLGGQVGLADHLKLGHQVRVAAQSGVMKDIPDGETWMGYPAAPAREAQRNYLLVRRLADLQKRIIQMEKQLAAPPEKKS